MARQFADRLLAAIEEKGSPVCVGIDPDAARLPEEYRGSGGAVAIGEFARAVAEAVAPHVPAVKPQSAYFEHYGAEGVAAYYQLVRHARQLGLIVIGDVKRGDIGSTARMYATGHLALPDSPDAITVNGYFGAVIIIQHARVHEVAVKTGDQVIRNRFQKARILTDQLGRAVAERQWKPIEETSEDLRDYFREITFRGVDKAVLAAEREPARAAAVGEAAARLGELANEMSETAQPKYPEREVRPESKERTFQLYKEFKEEWAEFVDLVGAEEGE